MKLKDFMKYKSGGKMKNIIFLLLFFTLIAESVFAGDYIIGGGDVLQISVWGSPELSSSVTVRPDGKISIPALGEITASGLTPTELKNKLEKELENIVKKPIVTIIVTGITNSQIYVFGNGVPVFGTGVPAGKYTLSKETTLLQFLTQLGPLQNADLENSYLLRNKQKIKVGFSALLTKGDLSQDIILEPNDILFIPDNFGKRIKIVGAVKTPATIPYREGLTIIDVILSAGGFTEFAKKNDILVIRGQDEKEIRRTVRVKDIFDGKLAENIKIMPGDFIIVPESFF